MVRLSMRGLLTLLVAILAAIFVAHLALQLTPGDGWLLRALRRLVNVADEPSIPTYLAIVLLTTCGLIAIWLARLERQVLPGWGGLAVVFVGAGAEELLGIHEMIGEILRNAFSTSGYLLYAWVVPGFILSLLIALVFLRFVLACPKPTRNGLVAGAALFLLGAIGLEAMGANAADELGQESVAYILYSTAEEALEFAGILVWLRSLLAHQFHVAGSPTLRLVRGQSPPAT